MDLPRQLLRALTLPLATGAVCGGLAWPAAAAPQTYTLDPEHSFVHFELMHFGTSTVRGRFGPVNGAVVIDVEAGTGSIGLRLPTASVSTGMAVFDARICEADLLACAAQPDAFFVASRLRFEGRRLAEVRAEFTLRGVSQPLSLTAQRFHCRRDEVSGRPVEVCGGDFEGEMLRGEFGATFGLPFVGNRVRLQVQVEGRRPLLP